MRARTAGRQGGLEREAAGLGKLCRAAGATVRTSSTLEGSGKPLAGFVIPSECRKGHRRAERLGHMHVPVCYDLFGVRPERWPWRCETQLGYGGISR